MTVFWSKDFLLLSTKEVKHAEEGLRPPPALALHQSLPEDRGPVTFGGDYMYRIVPPPHACIAAPLLRRRGVSVAFGWTEAAFIHTK